MTNALIKHLRRLSNAKAREQSGVRSHYGDKLQKLLDAQHAAMMSDDFAEFDRLGSEIDALEERHKRILSLGEIAPGAPTKQ